MAAYTSAFRIFSIVVSDPKYGDATTGACMPIPSDEGLKFDIRLELVLKFSDGVELDFTGDGVGDGFWRYPTEDTKNVDSHVSAKELYWVEGSAHSGLTLSVPILDIENMPESSPWVVAFTAATASFDRVSTDGSRVYFHFLLPPGASSNTVVFSGPERASSFWTAFRKCYEE